MSRFPRWACRSSLRCSIFSVSCSRINLGKLVEVAKAEDLYTDPRMTYTEALLSAIPENQTPGRRERIVLRGEVPSALDPPSGCRFRTRCWKAESLCAEEVPVLREGVPDHWAACHFAESS
jgi:oligopeptide/dipeptide ABC transporter ATP-binding protein